MNGRDNDKMKRFVRKTSDGLPIERESRDMQTFITKEHLIYEYQLFREKVEYGKEGTVWRAKKTYGAISQQDLTDITAAGLTAQIHRIESQKGDGNEDNMETQR